MFNLFRETPQKPGAWYGFILGVSLCWITCLSLFLTGGRYKKEVLVDGQSHLLLIREEAGPPDAQVLLCDDVFVCVCVCECDRPVTLHISSSISAQWDNICPSILFLLQFSSWADAVILVFSLENEASFQELYQLYSQLSAFRSDIPVIVVGTQGKRTNQSCTLKYSEPKPLLT